MHSRQWRALLGGNYRKVIVEAKEGLGYIEINERYSVDRFPKSYRLAKRYRRPETSLYRLTGRVGIPGNCRIRLNADDETGHKLASCFDAVTIPDDIVASGWDQFCFESIRGGRWYATRCEYGRFHTSATCFPKSVRRSVRLSGRAAVEVDVSNCQPLIVGLLAARNTKAPPATPHQHNPNTICCIVRDLQNYLDLCEAGKVYDYLLDHAGDIKLFDCIPPERRRRHATDRRLTRSDIKRQFIVAMFAPNETARRMPLFSIIAREFPTVASFINQAKHTEYQALARDCQRLESKLMIDRVASRLADQWPILTVHDSILSAEENADAVASEIRSAFADPYRALDFSRTVNLFRHRDL